MTEPTEFDYVLTLTSRVIQISTVFHPGDCEGGCSTQLFVLCEDGSVWAQYHGVGYTRHWINHVPPLPAGPPEKHNPSLNCGDSV